MFTAEQTPLASTGAYSERHRIDTEQAARMRKMYAAVVIAALDDAVVTEKKRGTGTDEIRRWASSRDGRETLSCAGIEPSDRTVKLMMAFVARKQKVTAATKRET